MATKKDERQLTNYQIVSLARAISSRDMEIVSLKYLDIDSPIINKLRITHAKDSEAFNTAVFQAWAYKNEESDQVQVRVPIEVVKIF